MDFTVGKMGAKAATQAGGFQQQGAKAGPSRFDAVRADLAEQLASQLKLPPQAEVSPRQKMALEQDLRTRLDQGGVQRVRESIEQQAAQARARFGNVAEAVSKIPQHDAFGPLRERFQAVEREFQASGKIMSRLPEVQDPRQLLQIQMQMYRLTQNVEIMSKVVDQLGSGLRTVLQTNVG